MKGLRRALRGDPATLPFGAAPAPLTGNDISASSPATRAAHQALPHLLTEAAMARRYWHDGVIDIAGQRLRRQITGEPQLWRARRRGG